MAEQYFFAFNCHCLGILTYSAYFERLTRQFVWFNRSIIIALNSGGIIYYMKQIAMWLSYWNRNTTENGELNAMRVGNVSLLEYFAFKDIKPINPVQYSETAIGQYMSDIMCNGRPINKSLTTRVNKRHLFMVWRGGETYLNAPVPTHCL